MQSDFWNQEKVLILLEKCQIDTNVIDACGKTLKNSKKSSLQLYSNVVWSEFVSQASGQFVIMCDGQDERSEAWWYFERKRKERVKK